MKVRVMKCVTLVASICASAVLAFGAPVCLAYAPGRGGVHRGAMLTASGGAGGAILGLVLLAVVVGGLAYAAFGNRHVPALSEEPGGQVWSTSARDDDEPDRTGKAA